MIKFFILAMLLGGVGYGFAFIVRKYGWLDLISFSFITLSLLVISKFALEVFAHDKTH